MSFSGYVLNGEEDNFYYMSLSRLHSQRILATNKLSACTPTPLQHHSTGSDGAQVEEGTLESETEAQATEADSKVRADRYLISSLSLFTQPV